MFSPKLPQVSAKLPELGGKSAARAGKLPSSAAHLLAAGVQSSSWNFQRRRSVTEEAVEFLGIVALFPVLIKSVIGFRFLSNRSRWLPDVLHRLTKLRILHGSAQLEKMSTFDDNYNL